ncbi:DUF2637 domain-containing protein [Streptomyces sp. BE303]|uniref:DUF2637 domain-containing protein n=1 Tax=Streptomyces sp. BE303 TaxID=3002528 RepID=UPI002E77B959|nr:DUF2637 domain-containing protein [Streptomyces sp. BE303]MED7954882.1 DUF2637 domain-containing protein [Streptomyces sp. BE303]
MARPSLTKAHRGLLGVVAAGACLISGIGFAGSYSAVRDLAAEKGFGSFSYAFPIGVDAGIVVLLALDLVLTWLRIPFPLLRQTAWLLTVATIAFNAAASWGDPLGMGMHAVIPVLFVVVVEASRHAVGRIAAITADRHMESVRLMRWVLSPVPTFRLWRRMKLWELRSYDEVVRLEQNRLVYRAQLRFRYGRGWRRSAPIQALLPLKLAKYGVPLDLAVLDGLDEEGRTVSEVPASREVHEVHEVHDGRAAGALAPAAVQNGPQADASSALRVGVPAGPQAAVPAAPQPQAHDPQPEQPGRAGVQRAPQQQAQEARPQAEPVAAPVSAAPSAVAPMPAEVAAPMLAKLAAVRLRAVQEPEGEEQQTPPQPREELNVWTERAVRTTGHQDDGAPGGRVPGQASPWFKPPRPTESEPEPQPVAAAAQGGSAAAPYAGQAGRTGYADEAEYPEQDGYVEQAEYAESVAEQGYAPEFQEDPAFDGPAERPIGPVPRPGSYRLDPEVVYAALVSYIDTFENQPDPQRLADWLTREYGVIGNRADGSVHPKEVAELIPELRDRYAASGRD